MVVLVAVPLGAAGGDPAAAPPRPREASRAPRPRPPEGTSATVRSVGRSPPAYGSTCTISGTEGDDRLRGTSGKDVLCGGPGADVLSGGSGGPDTLRGGPGDDVLEEKDGQPYDRLDGGQGADTCRADAGDSRSGCTEKVERRHDRRVPILLYHVIEAPRPETPNPHLWVSPARFAEQMRYLAAHGYEVVTLQEAYDYWHGAALPRKPVVVSFDDGFRSHSTRALPILARLGWAGTLNLTLSHIGRGGLALSPRRVRRLIAAGWELDAHTVTHPLLTGLDSARLRAELAGARRTLQRRFGVPVNFVAYPVGAYDSRVVAAVRRAGYLGATTTEYGLAWIGERFELDRITVSGGDTVAGFAAKLEGAGG